MRILPREEKFFELFLSQVRLIAEASALLEDGLKGGNHRLVEVCARINDLEHKADDVLAEIVLRLNQTFITPLDAEDIHALATRLDNVMDGIEDLAYRVEAYGLEPVPEVAIDVTTRIGQCVREIQLAFEGLKSKGEVASHCVEVGRIEEEVDDTIRKTMRHLFRTEKDPIHLLRMKEVLDALEETTDFCEDVAVALQNVIVKNS